MQRSLRRLLDGGRFEGVTPARSALMSKIKGKDTGPELIVRRLVHALGYRYKLHDRSLPGSPDLVFSSRQKVILVHGCFWHWHHCMRDRATPRTRSQFWQAKLQLNRARDRRNRAALRQEGWDVLTVWECETADLPRLAEAIRCFLERPTPRGQQWTRSKRRPSPRR